METGIFDLTSQYYDLLYAAKPYAQEVAFIDEVLQEFGSNVRTIADLGCGTGIHDWLLAGRGYDVQGIDSNPEMLKIASDRVRDYPDVQTLPRFRQGSLESFALGGKVDAVISLFDVVSYLRNYDSLRSFAQRARASLRPGGIVLFDCWYGPAVHGQRPGTRIKRLQNEEIELTRISEGEFYPDRNHVDVNYEIFIKRKADGQIKAIRETHLLRCYFQDEMDEVLGQAGLERLFCFNWFDRTPPTVDSWSVLFGYILPS